MGQPEDYLVDDEIFEDEPKHTYQRRKFKTIKTLILEIQTILI